MYKRQGSPLALCLAALATAFLLVLQAYLLRAEPQAVGRRSEQARNADRQSAARHERAAGRSAPAVSPSARGFNDTSNPDVRYTADLAAGQAQPALREHADEWSLSAGPPSRWRPSVGEAKTMHSQLAVHAVPSPSGLLAQLRQSGEALGDSAAVVLYCGEGCVSVGHSVGWFIRCSS